MIVIVTQKLRNCFEFCFFTMNLTKRQPAINGSDTVPETGLIRWNAVSLVLNSGSEKERKSYHKNYLRAGWASHPLQKKFGVAVFGGLTDKFRNHWLLKYHKEQTDS